MFRMRAVRGGMGGGVATGLTVAAAGLTFSTAGGVVEELDVDGAEVDNSSAATNRRISWAFLP